MTSDSTALIIPELIVGLGNPEPKYDNTRHNIGFAVVDELAKVWQMPLKENKRFQGLFSEGVSQGGQKVRLLKPLTYMNRSGQAVRAVTDWYKVEPRSVLVIYDDMDLPVGRLRMRLTGSAGGHNGMKSIIAHLGSQEFPRLRLGIGKSDGEKGTINHVLGKFAPEEFKVMDEILYISLKAIELSLKEGIEQSMNRYNGFSIDS
ncbi:MAG: aminoacyl-tRNA hydrolase [Hydrococcus sp. SU_1_0]|nr:aminoacyl-tRNA hydrolase [Hydrococcus sp. SU_1_0]